MSPQNLQEKRPTPPFPEQHQDVPGLESQMNNAAFQMVRQSIEEISSEEFDRTVSRLVI